MEEPTDIEQLRREMATMRIDYAQQIRFLEEQLKKHNEEKAGIKIGYIQQVRLLEEQLKKHNEEKADREQKHLSSLQMFLACLRPFNRYFKDLGELDPRARALLLIDKLQLTVSAVDATIALTPHFFSGEPESKETLNAKIEVEKELATIQASFRGEVDNLQKLILGTLIPTAAGWE